MDKTIAQLEIAILHIIFYNSAKKVLHILQLYSIDVATLKYSAA